MSPYRLLVCPLAETSARLGADVVRYTFIVEDFHFLLLASLLANLGVKYQLECCARLVYPSSSSSNALASCKSAVSNPSVNQP